MKIDFSTIISGIVISFIVGLAAGMLLNSDVVMAGASITTAIIFVASLDKE